MCYYIQDDASHTCHQCFFSYFHYKFLHVKQRNILNIKCQTLKLLIENLKIDFLFKILIKTSIKPSPYKFQSSWGLVYFKLWIMKLINYKTSPTCIFLFKFIYLFNIN
jgi:hypothetical protein